MTSSPTESETGARSAGARIVKGCASFIAAVILVAFCLLLSLSGGMALGGSPGTNDLLYNAMLLSPILLLLVLVIVVARRFMRRRIK